MSDEAHEKGDAAKRAVDHLIEQKLVDPFQRYNIAQVIREEYATDAIARPSVSTAELEKLEKEFRRKAALANYGCCSRAIETRADEFHTLISKATNGRGKQ